MRSVTVFRNLEMRIQRREPPENDKEKEEWVPHQEARYEERNEG